MSDTAHRTPHLAGHPDVSEMRERLERVAGRREAVTIDGLVLLTGLYTAISPWVVHFHGTNPNVAVNNLVVGIALALMGLALTLAGERMYRVSWTCALIGVWMIISPWVVSAGHSATAGIIWNNVWIGVAAILLGLGGASMVRAAERTDTR